jgi:hypothetical protein
MMIIGAGGRGARAICAPPANWPDEDLLPQEGT